MRSVAVAPILMLIASLAAAAEPVKETNRWDGKVADDKLSALAPEHNFIDDQDTLDKVWTAWRDDEVPQIDFSDSLILVGTVPGPNRVFIRPTLDNGDLRLVIGGTKIGGPGFGYALFQVPRAGVEKVNGTPIGDRNATERNEGVQVKVKGRLETGIFAIGGETTGTTITAGNITWELDLGEKKELAEAAEKLSGKSVVVKGSLERKAGVEIKERWIVHVTSLESAE